MNEYRASVDGWRWDYLSPKGWFPWSVTMVDLTSQGIIVPMGFFRWREGACKRRPTPLEIFTGVPAHEAPGLGCVCGMHGIEHLSLDVADALESLAASRELWGVDDPDNEWMISLALSRVTFTNVLPGLWEGRASAQPSQPGSIPDPPGTIRGHRMTYRSIMVDREWQVEEFPAALPDWWPPMRYVPDLAEWVRQECAAEVTNLLPEA